MNTYFLVTPANYDPSKPTYLHLSSMGVHWTHDRRQATQFRPRAGAERIIDIYSLNATAREYVDVDQMHSGESIETLGRAKEQPSEKVLTKAAGGDACGSNAYGVTKPFDAQAEIKKLNTAVEVLTELVDTSISTQTGINDQIFKAIGITAKPFDPVAVMNDVIKELMANQPRRFPARFRPL